MSRHRFYKHFPSGGGPAQTKVYATSAALALSKTSKLSAQTKIDAPLAQVNLEHSILQLRIVDYRDYVPFVEFRGRNCFVVVRVVRQQA